MNRVDLIGRLTAKPELRYTATNTPYTRFTVAISRQFTDVNGERETDFINVVVWRKQAENVCNYLNKGSLVSVEGRLQTGNYTDKDGNKRYTTDVVADNVQFLEGKTKCSIEEDTTSGDPYEDMAQQVEIDDDFLD